MEGSRKDVRCCTIRDFVCDNINTSMSRDTDLKGILSVSICKAERKGRPVYQAVLTTKIDTDDSHDREN